MTIETVPMSEFGTLLRQFRSRARLTQNELAGLSAVSARTIRNLEAGRAMSPRSETVRLLSDGLRLSAASQTRLRLAAGQSPVGAALHATQGRLPSWDAALDRDPYGREQDLRMVRSCVRNGTSRIVSISGFGGVGKSRLAAALAREAQHTLRTQWLWLPPSTSPDTAASPADMALRQWYQELSDGQSDAAEDLVRLVGDQPYLIIVDGVDGPASGLEAALRELIRRCPRLTVIETTRYPLPLENRHVVPLKPLRLPAEHERPTSAQLVGHPALNLLLPLARATQPDFQESDDNIRHVLDVCRSLDGLPRALENAAKWFAFYSPADVAAVAREDPCALAAASSDMGESNWLLDAVASVLSGLTGAQRGLAVELAGRAAPWSIEDLIDGDQRSSGEIMESLRTFLALGVIRPADGSDTGACTYTVLNLLRPSLT
jgi:transcriptional regulator with XRE-family HTH domain